MSQCEKQQNKSTLQWCFLDQLEGSVFVYIFILTPIRSTPFLSDHSKCVLNFVYTVPNLWEALMMGSFKDKGWRQSFSYIHSRSFSSVNVLIVFCGFWSSLFAHFPFSDGLVFLWVSDITSVSLRTAAVIIRKSHLASTGKNRKSNKTIFLLGFYFLRQNLWSN